MRFDVAVSPVGSVIIINNMLLYSIGYKKEAHSSDKCND